MLRRKGFTLIELLVVIAVIALLIGILVPSLGAVRRRAKTVICATNERALVSAYRIYVMDTGTTLYSSGHSTYGAWDFQLLGRNYNPTSYYVVNGMVSNDQKMRFCPETDANRRFTGASVGTAELGWDCRYGPGGGSTGSYAMNNWLYKAGSVVSSGTTPANQFYDLKRATTNEVVVPVFVDSVWHDFIARTTDVPGVNLADPEAGTSPDRTLADAAVNRHNKAVNVSFWDEHIETVKLGNLWAIKWSKGWTRSDPYPIR